MKKIIAILFVLLTVFTMAFAVSHTINFGAGYHFDYGTVAKPSEIATLKNRYLKNSAVGVQIGYNLELNNGLVVYDNVGLGYNVGFKAKGSVEETESPWAHSGKWEKLNGTSFLI